ncbi:MAG: Cytochrome c biogenesis protein Ccs1 [Candidatus Omnitrophica bacterium]|nr:Cytochrome c biogenesis protein Ccs1 [Candidatus Omnitrophota bacterium]
MDGPRKERTLLKQIGSLSFAVVLLAALTALLIVSTFVESSLGTAVAQRWVYQTGWFDAFLALLGLNILCSTLTRWPFKKKHTGFVVTHTGILLVLAGSLLTRLSGVEGQLYVPEGISSDRIFQTQYEIVVEDLRDHKDTAVFPLGRSNKPGSIITRLEDGSPLTLVGTVEAAEWQEIVDEAPDGTGSAAARVRFTSKTMGSDFDLWLVRDHPERPDAHLSFFGPAAAVLSDAPPAPDAPPALIVTKDAQLIAEIPLSAISESEGASTPIEGTPYRIEEYRYYPDARVGPGGQLVSVSKEPNNPAVQLKIVDGSGQARSYLRFANHPDFESMHAKREPDPLGLTVAYRQASHAHHGATFTIYPENGSWRYQARSRTGAVTASGEVRPGQAVDTGWSDFQATIVSLFDHARVSTAVRPSSAPGRAPAARLSVRAADGQVLDEWIGPDRSVKLPGGRPLIAALRQRSLPVPFSITLKDFRKIDYPGTRRAASFESDIVLTDPAAKVQVHRTIRMNEPMDYAGYRIFQSSYIQEPAGEASIFTVAKNPGVTLLYTGSTVLFVGTFITFFVPALSSFRHDPRGSS